MSAVQAVGNRYQLVANANVLEEPDEYLIQLDVSDFTENELTIEADGSQLTVRGKQLGTVEDDGEAFRVLERLEESFRLPDDADADRIAVAYKHGTLEIRVPRVRLEPRLPPIERPRYLVDPDAEAC